MNDLDALIRDTLRADAQEASVKTDTPQELHELTARLDHVDRRRRTTRVWAGLAAVAAVVIAVAVVVSGAFRSQTSVPPVGTPSPSASTKATTYDITTSTLTPQVAASLPVWAASSTPQRAPGLQAWGQAQGCSTCSAPAAADRFIVLTTPPYFYAPGDPQKIVAAPSYAELLAATLSPAAQGTNPVSDRVDTTVDGRPAVILTTRGTASPGSIGCSNATDKPADCWVGGTDVLARTAIIDVDGRPLVVSVLQDASSPDTAGLLADFQQVLTTITIG